MSSGNVQGGNYCGEGTRNEIRALMLAGDLEEGCKYIVNNYSRGCLTDVDICLTASSVSSFSMDVDVYTTWDTIAWEGRYDIDTNRIVELKDNIGNHVGGRLGNEVDRFPWGKTNVHSNKIYNADVLIDCDTTQNINSNSWEARSYTDLRGFEGVFEQNSVDGYGRIYLRNVTQVDFRRNKIDSFAYLYFIGSSDILFRQNNFSASSYVRKFATSTGRWTMYNSDLSRGDVRHYDGIAYINQLNADSGGRAYLRNKGTSDIRNSNISDLSYFNTEGLGGVIRLWYSSLNSLAYIYQRAGVTAGNCYIYYSNFESCTFDMRSGSANWFIYYHKQNSNGYFRADDVSGIIRLYQNTLASRAEIQLRSTTAGLNIYYNTLHSYQSQLWLENISGEVKTFYYNSFSSSGRLRIINHSGPITAQHNFHSSFGQTLLQDNNATNIRLLYNRIESIARVSYNGKVSGRITLQGTTVANRAEIDLDGGTGNADIYYSTIEDYRARVRLENNTRVYIYSANLNSNGQHIATGGVTDIRNSTISSSGKYSTTNGGATTRLWNSNIHSLSQINSTGSYIYCFTSGNRLILNTAAFNLWYSRYNGIGTATLTANNSNRYFDYGTNGIL